MQPAIFAYTTDFHGVPNCLTVNNTLWHRAASNVERLGDGARIRWLMGAMGFVRDRPQNSQNESPAPPAERDCNPGFM